MEMKQPKFKFGEHVKVKNLTDNISFRVDHIFYNRFSCRYIYEYRDQRFYECDLHLYIESSKKKVLKPFLVKEHPLGNDYELRFYPEERQLNSSICFPAIGIPDQEVSDE